MGTVTTLAGPRYKVTVDVAARVGAVELFAAITAADVAAINNALPFGFAIEPGTLSAWQFTTPGGSAPIRPGHTARFSGDDTPPSVQSGWGWGVLVKFPDKRASQWLTPNGYTTMRRIHGAQMSRGVAEWIASEINECPMHAGATARAAKY